VRVFSFWSGPLFCLNRLKLPKHPKLVRFPGEGEGGRAQVLE